MPTARLLWVVLLIQVCGVGAAPGSHTALQQRCLATEPSGIKSPRVAFDCGTALAAAGEQEKAITFYKAGLGRADPIMHDSIIPRLEYQTAIAERAAGKINASASRFIALFEDLPSSFSGNIDWWHEGLTAIRDAGQHADAERLFEKAKKALPQSKWRNSWQIPRDIDERALDGAQPFHGIEQFDVPKLLQLHAQDLISDFQALQKQDNWKDLFEVNEHEAGGNVKTGSWRHLYLKRLNGTWDEAKCGAFPRVCSLLRDRAEIDGQIFGASADRSQTSTKPLASTQGVAILELAPQSHLRLHTGRNNFRLLAHLGLQVPKDLCGVSSGGEFRFWEDSSVLVLDDSFLHEAWNNSTEDSRYVLYASFFPPSLEPTLPDKSARVEL